MRFVVIGSEKDAQDGRSLIDQLRENGFEADGEFKVIRSLDDVTEVVTRAASPTRVLLLLSNDDGALFSSAVKLDETLARRSNSGAVVQGVLLEGERSPDATLRQVAVWRGAVPSTSFVRDLVQERIDAARPRSTPANDDDASTPPKDDDAWRGFSAWSRAIRSGLGLMAMLALLATSREGWLLKAIALVGVAIVFLVCDVTELRRGRTSGRRPVASRASTVGFALLIAGGAVLFGFARKSDWLWILGLGIVAVSYAIATFGASRAQRDGPDREIGGG